MITTHDKESPICANQGFDVASEESLLEPPPPFAALVLYSFKFQQKTGLPTADELWWRVPRDSRLHRFSLLSILNTTSRYS